MRTNTSMPRFTLGWIALGALILGNSGCESVGMADLPMHQEVGFDQVKPILQERCLPCHQGEYMGAKVPDFRTSAEVFDPGRQPALVIPGDPERSSLVQVTYLTESTGGAMPPLGHGLPLEEKNLLGEWIRQGACWPDGEVLQSAAVADMKRAR